MKKLILICVLLAAMLSPLGVCADDTAISYLQEDAKITITGKIQPTLRSENITLVIVRKGVNITQESFENPAAKEKLELVANTSADEEGEWKVIWYPSAVAHYAVKATVNSTGEVAEGEFYFVEESRKERIENALLSGTLTELETVFADKVTLSVLEYSDEEIARVTDTSKIGRALYYIRQDLAQASDIKEYIDLAIQMAEFNEKGTGFDAMTTAMSEFGTVEKLTFYNGISVSAVKNQVSVYAARGILECGLDGYSDLFTQSIVLAGVEKSTNYSFLGTYLDLLGNSTYDDADAEVKEDIQLALVGNSYTPQTLAAAITAAASPDGGDNNGNDNGNNGDNGGYSGGGGGGGYSTGMSNVDSIAPAAKGTFSDVTQQHWAFVAISNLRDRKILNGFEDNSYRPENPLTRAEAVTLLCRAFNIEKAADENAFADVKTTDWFSPYVNAAYSAGFVNGDGTHFNPDKNITRQDLCVMIYRFAQGNITNGNCDYTDISDVSDYAVNAVSALSTGKIINGFEDNTFRPQANATRAQMAQILYKYLLTSTM